MIQPRRTSEKATRSVRSITYGTCRTSIQSPHNQIAKVCRELSINAEENRLYAEAAELNYWAMDAQRKEHRGGTFAPWTLIWWYWALSGYGERHIRSALWLAGI